jgi:hypothetical protein
MIEIIDEPYTGDYCADYNLRRNKCEAARVLLSLKTRMLQPAFRSATVLRTDEDIALCPTGSDGRTNALIIAGT